MPAAAPSIDLPAVRAWARENGLKVGDRGRLPAGLVEQFLEANPQATSSSHKPGAKATAKPAALQTRKPAALQTRKPAASQTKRSAAGSKGARPAPASTPTAVAPGRTRLAEPTTPGKAKPADAAAQPVDVDAVLLDDEQVELLKDLPAVLEEMNTELDEIQNALKDVQAENAQLKQRLDRLENKRGLFNRK